MRSLGGRGDPPPKAGEDTDVPFHSPRFGGSRAVRSSPGMRVNSWLRVASSRSASSGLLMRGRKALLVSTCASYTDPLIFCLSQVNLC